MTSSTPPQEIIRAKYKQEYYRISTWGVGFVGGSRRILYVKPYLKGKCKRLGLANSGSKEQLVFRIRDYKRAVLKQKLEQNLGPIE